ncbi:hypothetical protein GGS21DRAFT_386995 [Xylaria nigripes]|nr:hypothetical protein GGS21DRAFT_386995 [Xylaria nigripes]
MAVSAPYSPPYRHTPSYEPSRCGDAPNSSPCDGSRCVLSRPTKRIRATHDVDGPGTDKLPVKKRRLRLRLVTSRLSRPFSLPATHILIRESGGTIPVLHRIQQLASSGGGARRAGHQSALVRKAAILNRIRICIRQAAVSRSHAIMAELAARGTALNRGLQLVVTGTHFPTAGVDVRVSLASNIHGDARSHTASSHSSVSNYQNNDINCDVNTADRSNVPYSDQGVDRRDYDTETAAYVRANTSEQDVVSGSAPMLTSASPAIPVVLSWPPADADDEEDSTAFPATSFHDRYADLSDDDMDDVYADFGVLFGSGSHPPEGSPGPAEEQFFEEYLDELDGISWVM